MGKAQYRIVGEAAIGSILYKGMCIEFSIDTADLEKVKGGKWHYSSNGYIATSVKLPVDLSGGGGGGQPLADLSGGTAPPAPAPKKKEVYLHNFLMQPGPNEYVYHISKNGLDNRRANLRKVEGSAAAALSATKKKRNVELPPLCGIKPEDIPRHIWYVQANGYHRDRFAIEFKTEGILWKSSSSKQFSLQEKLEQAKSKLKELYELYPHLDPAKEEELAKDLKNSFESLLSFQTSQQPPQQQAV